MGGGSGYNKKSQQKTLRGPPRHGGVQMDKLRQELSALRVDRALDIATRDGAFAREMLLGLGACGR